MSLSTEDGDSLRVVTLRDLPSDMHFAEMKTDERIPGENTVILIKNIFMLFPVMKKKHLLLVFR